MSITSHSPMGANVGVEGSVTVSFAFKKFSFKAVELNALCIFYAVT